MKKIPSKWNQWLKVWMFIWLGSPLGLALEVQWDWMPGRGKDIAVGADGSVFVVGNGSGNEPLYRWNESAKLWENLGGLAVQLAVGPNGDPWALDKRSNLSHFVDGKWVPIVENGSVTDVSVNTQGTVYVVGGVFCFCGLVANEKIYRLDGTNFVDTSLTGVVAHPDNADQLWVLSADAAIKRGAITNAVSTNVLSTIAAGGIDVSVSANGDVWVIRRDAFDGEDGDTQFWNGTEFESAGMFGVRIAIAPDGTPWVITDDNRIARGRRFDLRIADAATVEGRDDLVFPVTLSNPSTKEVRFDYGLYLESGGTIGTNSPVQAGSASLPPGQTSIALRLPVSNDTRYEGTRQYLLQLTNLVGANLRTTTVRGVVTDDEFPSFTITGVLSMESTNRQFRVRFSSLTNLNYEVQKRFALGGGANWQPVLQATGTGQVLEWVETAPDTDRGFFRVLATPR